MSSDPQKSLRLNQFLARAGLASRRAAEALIVEGRVTVNGSAVTELATTIDPAKDSVKVDGKRVWLPEETVYFALFKPKEVVSTLEDPEGRPCLTVFLPPGIHGLFPVGRLDYHSEGLLLLTNDGELSNRLLHPRYKVVKTYQVKVKGDPAPGALEALRRGIVLEGRRTLPVTIRRIPSRETRHTWLQVEMSEGRKNQLREMFFRIEHPVIKLKRSAVGPVRLGPMKPGEWRPLSEEEVAALKTATGLSPGGQEPLAPKGPETRRPRPERRAGGRDARGERKGPPERADARKRPRGGDERFRSKDGARAPSAGKSPRRDERRGAGHPERKPRTSGTEPRGGEDRFRRKERTGAPSAGQKARRDERHGAGKPELSPRAPGKGPRGGEDRAGKRQGPGQSPPGKGPRRDERHGTGKPEHGPPRPGKGPRGEDRRGARREGTRPARPGKGPRRRTK